MAEKLISKKKPFYPISKALSQFLKAYDRWITTPILYEDLLRFAGSVAVYDKNDEDSLWVRVYYSDSERQEIDYNLKKIYTLLHSDGNESGIPYLNVDAIEYHYKFQHNLLCRHISHLKSAQPPNPKLQ